MVVHFATLLSRVVLHQAVMMEETVTECFWQAERPGLPEATLAPAHFIG